VRLLRDGGNRVHLTIVGGGRLLDELREMAGRVLVDSFKFTGPLPTPAAVADVLKGCDVFALASRTEGLPRAMVEAMALGLACVGTRVGGIPELLEDEWLSDSGRPDQMAEKIQRLIDDQGEYERNAAASVHTAHLYSATATEPVRRAFLEAVNSLLQGSRSPAQRNDEHHVGPGHL
jgi:glycosyltransferase involved in cell wall biosynthesis